MLAINQSNYLAGQYHEQPKPKLDKTQTQQSSNLWDIKPRSPTQFAQRICDSNDKIFFLSFIGSALSIASHLIVYYLEDIKTSLLKVLHSNATS